MRYVAHRLAAAAMLLIAPIIADAKPSPYTLTTKSNGNFSYEFDVDISDYYPDQKISYYFGTVLSIPKVPGHLTFDLYENDAGSGLKFTEAFVVEPYRIGTGNRNKYADIATTPAASAKLNLFIDLGSINPSLNYGPYQGFVGVSGPAASGFKGKISFAAVPEPSIWAMMIVGFGMVGFAMRRKTVLRFV